MNIEELYRKETIKAVLGLFKKDFERAAAGTCMKIAGLPGDDLDELRQAIVAAHPLLEVVILTDGVPANEHEVTATKLVELRNLEGRPLVLIEPSSIQTPAEDSFAVSVFKVLSVSRLDERMSQSLRDEVPLALKPLVDVALAFCSGRVGRECEVRYLLALKAREWDLVAVGEELQEIGFISDTGAVAETALWRNRMNWNDKCADILSDFARQVPARVLGLPIAADSNQEALARFLGASRARTRLELMRELRASTEFGKLDFAKWRIPDFNQENRLKIRVGEVKSSAITIKDGDKTLTVLPRKKAQLKIRITADPAPRNFTELKYFSIVLVAVDGMTQLQEIRKVKVTAGPKEYRDVTLAISYNQFESGTYFLRVFGQDEDGNALNTEDDFKDMAVQQRWLDLRKEDDQASHAAFKAENQAKTVNESEDIFFDFADEDSDPNDDEEEDEKKSRKDKLAFAYQAFVKYRIAAMKAESELTFPQVEEGAGTWISGGEQQHVFHLKFVGGENYQIPVSDKLYRLERELLNHPGEFGSLNARLHSNPAYAGFVSCGFEPCSTVELQPLVEKRENLFSLIGASAPESSGVVETWLDLARPGVIEAIKDYVVQYQDALKAAMDRLLGSRENPLKSRAELIALQNVDTARVTLPLGGGVCRDVRLMSPLHPLRLAWFVNLLELYGDWEAKTVSDARRIADWTSELCGYFLGGLNPTNNPLVLFAGESHDLHYAGEMVFGWGVYVPGEKARPGVGLASDRQIKLVLSRLLNLPFDDRIDNDVSEEMIVRYVGNYVRQHPYVDKLVVNVFNPGDGDAFVRSLISLEKRFPDELRYEFRLCYEEGMELPGESFRELMNPESVISEKAECFSAAAENRLFPKIRFSINRMDEFLANPHDFSANISFLVNPFTVHTGLVEPDRDRSSDSLRGTVVESQIRYVVVGEEAQWCRSIWCGEGEDGPREFYHDSNRLLNVVQSMVAMSMDPMKKGSVPGTYVAAGAPEKALIRQIHAIADWVVTFDRSIGPEIFDSQNTEDESPYLLDFVPGKDLGGVSAFLTTRPGIEAYRFLEPYLKQVNLSELTARDQMLRMLEDIRTISGSLLLQAIATDNKAFEVLGLSLTKRMLEKKRYLQGAFLIPIDLHKDLFDVEGDDCRERADLVMAKIDLAKRVIDFAVVEVKCRTTVSGETLELLETKIGQQIEHSIEAFRKHFEMAGPAEGDRVDRPIKNLQLRKLLEFYICRAARFDQLSPTARKRYLAFCADLDSGYELSFSKLQIIYNFAAERAHSKEVDGDATRYVIGKELIDQIMDQESDLNTLRLEETLRVPDPIPECEDKAMPVDDPTPPVQPSDTPSVQQPVVIADRPDQDPDMRQGGVEESPQDQSQDVDFDSIVGGTDLSTPQLGVLGIQKSSGRKIAIDLAETTTTSLFGVQGAGKSYTIGTLAEMVLTKIPGVNKLPAPLAGVIFHYSESMDYAPEFTSMNKPNDNESQIRTLLEKYGAKPTSVADIVLLTPKAKVEERRSQYPGIEVLPISFKSTELSVKDWQFLLGAIGNDSMYIRQINTIMRSNRNNLTLEGLKKEVRRSQALSQGQQALALARLGFAEEYIDDTFELSGVLRPGRLVIVDLRDEFVEKSQALGLFVVMLNIFSGVMGGFNKFVVFDEAHKYMDDRELTSSIVTAIREMRHKGVSLVIASQDPPSLPNEIIELSSVVLMHKFNSPAWLKHIKKSITSLQYLTEHDMSSLAPGEAFLWANKSSDRQIMERPVRISTRPRATLHGGATIQAV